MLSNIVSEKWQKPIIIIVIAMLLGIVWKTGIDDGQTFVAERGNADENIEAANYIWNSWDFPSNVSFTRKSKTIPSLEEIVKDINTLRAGADGIIGTEDDRFGLNIQLELLPLLLKEAYPSAVLSPYDYWIFNHAAGVLQQMKVLYTDFNEYLLLVGSPLHAGGFSGDHETKSNTPEGCLLSQPPGECNSFMGTRLLAGQQKGYAVNATYMLEYGHGNVFAAMYGGVIQPTLFVSDNWPGLMNTMFVYSYGILWNTLAALV